MEPSRPSGEAAPGPALDVRAPLVIRPLKTHAELFEVEHIQRDVLAADDIEIVPVAQLRAVEHAGGQLAGAFLGERMVGFSYGFIAQPHGRGMEGLGLHSHMVAVRDEGRGRGIGQALKWNQREWCLQRGLNWISWTFDPLQARNANLNLMRLGAVAVEYLVDLYGPMSGILGGGQPTDRFLALWQLESPRVLGILRDGAQPPIGDAAVGATWALRASEASRLAEPVALRISGEVIEAGRPVKVAVPADTTYLLSAAPELALKWRAAIGAAMTRLFEKDYAAFGLSEGAYVLLPFSQNEKRSL